MMVDLRPNGVIVLNPSGKLAGNKELRKLEEWLKTALQRKERVVLINFQHVVLLDGVALNVLINAHVAFAKAGCQFKMCGLCPDIEQFFQNRKLDAVFDLSATEAEALASPDITPA